MRIGILGGSFDPPHCGHLALAHAAMRELRLDEVLFIPANKNPLKPEEAQSSGKHRLGMVRRLIAHESRMAVSDMEITRGGPSYTVDTLSELHAAIPGEYWLLLGSDAAKGLSKWGNPQKIAKLCRIGVALRLPATETELLTKLPPEFTDRVDIIRMDPQTVSSTELRERLVQGQSVASWIPADVIRYIQENKLYRG